MGDSESGSSDSLPEPAVLFGIPGPEGDFAFADGAGADSAGSPVRRPASQPGASSSSELVFLIPESQSGTSSEESEAEIGWGISGEISCSDGSVMVSPAAGFLPSRKVRNQDGKACSRSAVFFTVGASPGRMGTPRPRLIFSNSEVWRFTGSSPGLMVWESSKGGTMTGLRFAPQN